MLAIGLMSGTSLDGCDAALVEITKNGENETFKLLDYQFIPYSKEFAGKIRRNLANETAKLEEICSLNFELGYKFKDAVDKIVNKNNLQYSDISFVASHGQTIWHNPDGLNKQTPSTLQIGEAQVISVLTGIKVITNFRVADVIVGGQGAPLVPMFEYLYFKSSEKNVCLQNIGGMGNVTFIPKSGTIEEVFAFDTGPGNALIDYFTDKYYQLPYDEDGKIALSGKVIQPLLDYFIKNDEFLSKVPPKSTGREFYSIDKFSRYKKDLEFDNYPKQDIITTITEYTVYSIVYNYNKFIKNIDKVIVSGGGSHNKYIMKRLKELLGCDVYTLDEETKVLNFSDAKEAFAFAVLGYLSLENKSGNVKTATGGSKDVVLGQITLANKR